MLIRTNAACFRAEDNVPPNKENEALGKARTDAKPEYRIQHDYTNKDRYNNIDILIFSFP